MKTQNMWLRINRIKMLSLHLRCTYIQLFEDAKPFARANLQPVQAWYIWAQPHKIAKGIGSLVNVLQCRFF